MNGVDPMIDPLRMFLKMKTFKRFHSTSFFSFLRQKLTSYCVE